MSPRDKILDREAVVRRFGRPRDVRVVFTNGCFDLLHAGHVRYLTEARALGDALVVGLNTDRSVRALKGPERPLVGEADRALVMAALGSVDAVTLFDEETPRALIEALLPDILVKGADYEIRDIVGADAVLAAGGRVEVVEFHPGYSTTALIDRIRLGS
jgi:D-beta-D-heptose 7-phosphate kinase/D-beta-D-heptose 1-phosphate adenosyltransferase